MGSGQNMEIRARSIAVKEARKLRKIFRIARPFPHISISGFLNKHIGLFEALKKEHFFKKDSDLFSFSQTNNLIYSKNKIMLEAVKYLSSTAFSSLISAISGIKLKAGALDVYGSLYEKTDYLLCHDDMVEGRKIAFILYLSKTFSKKDGGALTLYSNNGVHPFNNAASYPPIQNSLFIFQVSKISWHEVKEVIANRKRYAISGWLH